MNRARIIIGSVTVAAVAVSATLIGMRFAEPPTVSVPPQFESAPVLAPQTTALEATTLSEQIGTVEVPVNAAATIDPAVLAALAEIAESEDPGEADPLLIEPPLADDSVDGDACAPLDTAPPADCPEGLSGTVLAYTMPPPLWIAGEASPGARSATGPDTVYCDPVEHAATAIQYGIATNAPASITMRYWPEGNEAAAVTRVALSTAEQYAAWEAGLRDELDPTDDWMRPQHCLLLEDLLQGVSYAVELSVLDSFGREAFLATRFMGPDDRNAPPTRIAPIGSNVIFVSVPHRDDERANIRAELVGPGDDAQCSGRFTESDGLDSIVAVEEFPVTAAYLERHGYNAAFTKRTTTSFFVPEGSAILVCVVLQDRDAPGYDWNTANHQIETVLQSPDRTVPTVRLINMTLLGSKDFVENSVVLSAGTRDGVSCGGWTGPGAGSGATTESGIGGAELCSAGTTGSFGRFTSGDIVVRSTFTDGDDETTDLAVLPLGRQVCEGVCDLPAPTYYSMPISSVAVMLMRVDWSQGNTNGLSEWAIGARDEGDPGRVRADAAQMDTTVVLTATESVGALAYDVSFPLSTDRPVTYTANLFSLSGTVPCFRADTVATVTGTSNGLTTVTFDRACAGASYWVEVLLTDGTGTTARWTYLYPRPLWLGGTITTPTFETNLELSYATYPVSGTTPEHGSLYLNAFSVLAGSQELAAPIADDDRCTNSTHPFRAEGVTAEAVDLGENTTITVTVQTDRADARVSGSNLVCTAHGFGGAWETPVVLTATVNRADLAGDGVTISMSRTSTRIVTVTVREID